MTRLRILGAMMARAGLLMALPLQTAWSVETASDEVLPPGAPVQTADSPSTAAPASAATASKKPKTARRDSGKDAEGTAAPNRFEAETVIKSQYTLDGKPLEVDPD